MPAYEGLIKYPVPADRYNTAYGEPQWWEDLAVTTSAEIRERTKYRSHISGSFNADEVEDGVDLVHASVSQTGTPGQGTWWIDTATIAGESRMQVAVSYGASPRVMRRFRGSVSWSGWERTDAGAIDLSTLGGGGSGASPAAFKTAPLALTVGGSAGDGGGSGIYRMPVKYAATITRWRIHFRNNNPRFGTDGPSVNISSVYFGPASSGAFQSAPTQIGSGLSTGGGEAVTPWQSTPIDAGTEYAVSYAHAGGATNKVVGGGWSSTSVLSTAAVLTPVVGMPLDAWIEAEVPSNVPVIAAFGDSLSSGVGATLPVFDSWLSQWCRANGALPVHYTASGDTMAGWADSNAYKWQRWQNLSRPDAVIHNMGNNDVFGGATLETLQARRAVSVGQLRDLVSPVIYTATITPRTSSTGAEEQTRRNYNAWLKGYPDAARDVFDFVPAISGDDENISPEFDADGIHLNTAGYAAVAGTITRPLTGNILAPVAARLAPLEYDSGWRNVSESLESGIGGAVFLRRKGSDVHMMLTNVTTTTAGNVNILALPVGFRPLAISGANWRNGTVVTDNGDTVRVLSFFNNRMRILSMPAGKQLGGYIIWSVPPELPATLPGSTA